MPPIIRDKKEEEGKDREEEGEDKEEEREEDNREREERRRGRIRWSYRVVIFLLAFYYYSIIALILSR
jgi:hypothetical protein